MKPFTSTWVSMLFGCVLIFAVSIAPQAVQAAGWEASAGAQSNDMGRQALAFLANELWIHAGDSITWTFPTPEIHTVTFLKQNTTPQQVHRLAQASPAGAVQEQRPMARASMAPRA